MSRKIREQILKNIVNQNYKSEIDQSKIYSTQKKTNPQATQILVDTESDKSKGSGEIKTKYTTGKKDKEKQES